MAFFAFIGAPHSLSAAFLDPYWSSRVAALGGAFAGLSDDASQVFYNSAAAAKVRQRSADFSYARLFAGLDEANFNLSQFSYHQPYGKYSAVGLGWGSFTSTTYRELTIALSLSRDLKPLFKTYDGELAVGVTVRYLSRAFDMDERTSADPVFAQGSRKNTAALDLHVYSVPDPIHLPGLSLGLSVKGINRPNVGFRDNELLPLEVNGGLAWRIANYKFPIDISAREGEVTPHFGAEADFWDNRVHIRAGSDRYQIGTGFGYEHRLSTDFSLMFDYAFLWPLELRETSGSHRATLGVKF